MYDFYEKLAELTKKHSRLAMATVIKTRSSTPREEGAKMIILPYGKSHGTLGGGKLELLVIGDAVKAIKDGGSVIKEYKLNAEDKGGVGMECGGEATVFIDVITHGDRLLILGGGHIGLALYKMALEAGFSVVVVDERAEYANSKRFPLAEEVLITKVDGQRIKELVEKDTYIVVVTHEHKQDKLAVKNLINLNYRYLGMIGSAKKVKKVLSELEAEGVPKEKLEGVYSPIGLDIKAETPGEIAVSIMAELVHVRHSGEPSQLSLAKQ